MKRIEIVENKLIELSAEHGITAGELSTSLGLSRANVSSDLNRLCEEGKAEKSGSKPVYYKICKNLIQQNAEIMLTQFVHSNQSLFHCVEEAKAAVLYPPNGMHMLFFGETGVGKSMFAEIIYKYAHEKGCISANAPFIDFNCADYADNPQLLVSQLMGTKKGAYTGADTDKPGLIEKADGGILFLDEVHRLPPQGQEMLFTFIDKGVYRRLGETEAQRHASVLIICATTENPSSNLLKTFVRRIPMIIKIPNLSERSADERLNLISGFFINESSRLKKPIFVSVNSVRSLLSYNCPNNIGQLKNDIQIICARAYSNYVSGKKDELCIVSLDLPDYIREGLYLETSHRMIWNRFVGNNKRFCVFDSTVKNPLFQNDESNENIYDMIDIRMRELKEAGADDSRIEKELSSDIQLYFQKYTAPSSHPQNFSSIKNLVGMDIIYTVDKILTYAEKTLRREFKTDIQYALTVHIYNAINRVRCNRKIVNPQLNDIRRQFPNEFCVALESLKIINQKFNVDMPIDEAGFLTAFFCLDNFRPNAKVQVIVIAHGVATATSMVETANRLLGNNYAVGINASLDESPQKVYIRLKEFLKCHTAKSGVLLLVDMGSLMNFSSDIKKELGIEAKSIPLVSTLHVIEASRKASLGYSLDYVYEQTLHVNDFLLESLPVPAVKSRLPKMFIVTICTTGEGSAALMKNILDGQLNYHESICETVALKLTDMDNIKIRLNTIAKVGKILCIVSSFSVDFSAPRFGLADILEGNAIAQIQNLINQENAIGNIGKTFSTMLKNDGNGKILDSVRTFVETVETKLNIKLVSDVRVGVFCHLGCMVDRLIEKLPVGKFPDKEKYIRQNNDLFCLIKKSCRVFEKDFNTYVPDDEICYIANFFAPENCELIEKT